MTAPLKAHTLNEVRYYLMVRPCPACHKGPWVSDTQLDHLRAGRPFSLKVRCQHCSHAEELLFVLEHDLWAKGPQSQIINPTDRPSTLIDLAQWLSLFYMLLESSTAQGDAAASRRHSYQAALCLAEALKFYADNELPPQSAFFSPTGQAAFREHPENFARQRLRAMQEKLPALPAMARRIHRDDWVATKKWWQFWRR